jgi:hypothetical protein
MKFKLIYYFDVWGNSREGFEVNNQCEQAIMEFPDWPTNKELLQRLKNINFIKKTTRMNSVEFDNSYMEAYCINERNGKPFCFVEQCYDDTETPYHIEYGYRIDD